ncbi:formate dehydrogenase subunit gamma [Desulfurispira natronophila]|uniref:Cytochrome b subunit of formate dehydrogenase n=1 Tax=Desulfurispira natronophila TaxID=682562 RepID=A0A7W7Y4D2_9BACT|nr:cytochrome b/b6 domain-containing protein [Desulfurispira natronophila]MBB5021860.1 cytochrome b subunit of formate dehydrogenase [Desulfurispira natronophila]
MATQNTVLRHNRIIRTTHWTIAISALLLLFSGFGELPMYGRYGLVNLPGMAWSSNYEIHLIIHYIAAFFFTTAVSFHLVHHTIRREFATLPRRGDAKESLQIIKAMLTKKPEPPHGKFLAEQRLAYVAMGGVSLLLILTGLFKTWKNIGNAIPDPMLLQWITYAHTLLAMPFLLLLFAHLGAFIVKENRPLFKSMFTGRVPREYAEHRHPKWDADRED